MLMGVQQREKNFKRACIIIRQLLVTVHNYCTYMQEPLSFLPEAGCPKGWASSFVAGCVGFFAGTWLDADELMNDNM
jgi:hypothetical protein